MPAPNPPDPRDEAATVTNIGDKSGPPGSPGAASPNDRATAAHQSRSPSSRTHFSQNFRAGELIAGRYRIVAALGKGGMGEVFRADDLELGVPVALKFLPLEVSADPLRLEHFRSEVRLARQISHQSVCRVYDIAQVETAGAVRHFLSMEFIDGEDLTSLLRRIGRLPQDKAVEIARQICFGVAAAHELGVVHRDLKPANIMLDGRGRARITDFGVAGIADELNAKGDIASGTPEYMAPEQLEGREVTKRSDIYSMGLVLFELFTGKPAFKASTMADLRAQRRGETPLSRPSTIVPDLDPAVERVILRCLETEPSLRPQSVMAIAAALPGGDPLAAALAAGETPSPELVAASGGTAIISPRMAALAVTLILASAAVILLALRPLSLFAQTRPAKSAEVLADRAQEILKSLGHDRPHLPGVARLNLRQLNWLRDASITAAPGPFTFWYRQAPTDYHPSAQTLAVSDTDPFPSQIGEAIVRTDDRGRLEALAVIPPSRVEPAKTIADPEPIFNHLFELAGRDRAAFTPIDPLRRPPFQTDILRAWRAPDPDRPDAFITIHAALTDSRPTFFHTTYSYMAEPQGWGAAAVDNSSSAASYALLGVVLLIVASMTALVWRNLRDGRGDRHAAMVGGLAVVFLDVLQTMLGANVAPEVGNVFFTGSAYARALWVGGMCWMFYIALEPAARRLFPRTLITWSRLVRGRVSDSLVARDILTGVTAGLIIHAGLSLTLVLSRTLSHQPLTPAPIMNTIAYLRGFAGVTAKVADFGISALMFASGSLLLLVVGRAIFRSTLGAILLCITGISVFVFAETSDNLEVVVELISHAVLIALMLTRGLLAAVTYWFVLIMSGLLAIGPNWTGLGAPAWIPALTIAALTAWSLRCGMRATKAIA